MKGTITQQLNDMAQKWAQKLADTDTFEHSGTDGVGENIYASSGTVNGKDAVGAWYSEIKDYDFAAPGFGMNTGINFNRFL